MDISGAYGQKIFTLVQTACDKAKLPLLPAHIPGLLMTFSAYQLSYMSIGPWLSAKLFPKVYPHLRDRNKVRWDENAVSLIQAIVICALAGQVMLFDDDRKIDSKQERIWGYSEPAAMVLTVANGYFLWHLIMMVRYREVFGWAMVAHGLAVTFLMMNGYGGAFMIYTTGSYLFEFSTIFLDIQCTLRLLQMEGTPIQIANGVALFLSFFVARILYGTYFQTWFYVDLWLAFKATEADIPLGRERVATWLLACYALSTVTLQSLNYLWFYKISKTVHGKLFGKKVAKE